MDGRRTAIRERYLSERKTQDEASEKLTAKKVASNHFYEMMQRAVAFSVFESANFERDWARVFLEVWKAAKASGFDEKYIITAQNVNQLEKRLDYLDAAAIMLQSSKKGGAAEIEKLLREADSDQRATALREALYWIFEAVRFGNHQWAPATETDKVASIGADPANERKRRCYDRDHTFLKWKKELRGGYGHRKAIRDRWNRENPDKKLEDGSEGIETVKKAIIRAEKEAKKEC